MGDLGKECGSGIASFFPNSATCPGQHCRGSSLLCPPDPTFIMGPSLLLHRIPATSAHVRKCTPSK